MTIGTIKSMNPTEQGGMSLQLITENGTISALAFKELNLYGLKVGSKADFILETKTSAKGNRWSQLKSYSFETSQPIGSVNTPVSKNGLSEPELRFVSNCVGNAITSKSIQSPSDIALWAKHALLALKNINDPLPVVGGYRRVNPNDLNDSLDNVG